MDKTPAPISLAAARDLPWKPGRSAEAFIDGDLEIRFTPRPTNGPQVPHQRDAVYIVAAGTGHYRVEERGTAVAPADLLLAAARGAHGFEDSSATFPIWLGFAGTVTCLACC